MSLMPLYFVPGVCKVNSAYAGQQQFGFSEGRYGKGRFIDMDGSRFVAGFPEKVGGWSAATSSLLTGVARGMRDWRDNSQNIRVAIGTHLKLYYYSLGTLTDITPWRGILTGTLTNPLSTTNGSATVTVAHTAHGLVTGDYVMLTTGSSVGGITPAGVFNPITVVDANTYTFVNSAAATGTVSGGGGTVSYTYYRVTLSGPFTTTSGSKTVVVAHTAHGANPNDFVTIAGASAVGGLTLSGEYQIQSTSANTYTISAASAATSGATGGGSPNFQYDINSGNQDASAAFGYGTGTYGGNGYGTTGSTSVLLACRTWSVWNYGQQLIASPSGGAIYVWDPGIGGRAYPLYNAPTTNFAVIVTPERFVVALGIAGSAMEIAWADQLDYTDWTSSATNTANSGRQIAGGAYMVGGIPVRDGVTLFSSNDTVFTLTYTGDNEVYSDAQAAQQAGFIGPLAAVVFGGNAYWMGISDFWVWNGVAQKLPSDDIRDYVFRDINLTQSAKFFARTIGAKNEVWFYYCSSSATEIDRYVIYHTDQGCWSIGNRSITSAIDMGLYPTPMSTDASGNVYNDETGTDANGSALDSYVTFGPLDISSGDRWLDYFAFVPDFERVSGNVSLDVLTRTYPNDADTVDGPYTIAANDSTPRIDLRGSCKMIGFKLESNVVGGDFRLGLQRVEAQPGAARR